MTVGLRNGTPIPSPGLPAILSEVAGSNLLVDFSAPAAAARQVPYIAQEHDHWCWAACFEMIGRYLGLGDMSQLAMARRVFGDGACADPRARTCNRGANPSQAAGRVGLSCSSRNRALNAVELGQNLGNGPVEVEFETTTRDGPMNHVALITALGPNGTVTFLDPWPAFGPSSPQLDQVHVHYHWGPWVRSYVQFARG